MMMPRNITVRRYITVLCVLWSDIAHSLVCVSIRDNDRPDVSASRPPIAMAVGGGPELLIWQINLATEPLPFVEWGVVVSLSGSSYSWSSTLLKAHIVENTLKTASDILDFTAACDTTWHAGPSDLHSVCSNNRASVKKSPLPITTRQLLHG